MAWGLAGCLLLALGRSLGGDVGTAPVLGPAPDPLTARVVSLDDPAAAGTLLALALQNAGESRGEAPSPRAFDLERVVDWLRLIDHLRPESELAPALLALEFAPAAFPTEARQLARVLAGMSDRDPLRRWPWRVHAVYLAGNRGGDPELARDLVRPLATLPPDRIPQWVPGLSSSINPNGKGLP
ncbi:MAG: hypothetical protein K9H25_11375 [Rhodospirillum sp.]|nr:hypothetical protein [Rhodospirillum sp.]MCF8489845.1 hypothetical protein [Rhodospirillum sp.]MCF8499660.1 hypothetical protein [Rhodospirillum sp.]